MAARTGLHKVARAKGWGLTVAGASVRYRTRVKMFDRIEMRSRLHRLGRALCLYGADACGCGANAPLRR